VNLQKDTALREEKWNAYSHGLGVVLSGIGFFILLQSHYPRPLLKGIIVYGISLLILFTASTVYHAVSHPPWKRKLRILDHISIYYLIAGTYTPVCLSLLKPSKGIFLLYLIWGLAAFGTVLKLFFTGKFEVFSLVLYGVMGWLVCIDFIYLYEQTTGQELFYLALGGALYTLGILFYASKKIPFNHLIWHFFVLGGALAHFFFIWSTVG
jgi:hemolysin III